MAEIDFEFPAGLFIKPGEFAMIGLKDGTQLLVDVTMSENHTFESEVTDYPVESGGSISDNIRPRPITVSMEGIISNTPLEPMLTARSVGFGDEFGEPEKSAQNAHAHLLQVFAGREPVTIRTSLGTYKSMAMTSLDMQRDSSTIDCLKFNARFQQISIANDIRTQKRTSLRRGSGKSLGTKTGKLYEKVIIWKKGVEVGPNGNDRFVGGAFTIHSRELVYRIPESLLKMSGDKIVPLTYEEVAALKQPVLNETTGRFFHEDRVTLLNAEELARFHKDMNRDRGGERTFDIDDPAILRQRQMEDLNATNKRAVEREVNQLSRSRSNL